ncbi:hypothetical protein ACFVAV_30140 [Nocardia sp. NPDC057663]|uniref:hypothetical protein n=1 Tax=Nocardia sp. NPDC057663 TaxID=3346201 RepID=UPI00366D4A24
MVRAVRPVAGPLHSRRLFRAVGVRDVVARLATADGTPGVIAVGTGRLLDALRWTVRHGGIPLADAITASRRGITLGWQSAGRHEFACQTDARRELVRRSGTRRKVAW